jgi:6-pyruvoyltetrahydropterin/6-carboxytetrahydropterin synthase
MYAISKSFGFAASHQLEALPASHPCSRLHGHNYQVVVELEAAMVDTVGMVYDYRKLAPFKAWLDGHLDHTHLNDVMAGEPTAEHLAALLYQVAAGELELPEHVSVAGVGVAETPTTWAWFRP